MMNSPKGRVGAGAGPRAVLPSVKNSEKNDLSKKTSPQLLETLDRLNKLLLSNSVKKLPDQGAKILGTIKEVEDLIRKKKEVDAGTKSLQIGQYLDFSEWVNACENAKPNMSYLYTPICKSTEEILNLNRGQDVFEGLTKKPLAIIDENGVGIEMVLEGDPQDSGPKPKWDESLMPPSKDNKSKVIGIRESIQLIKKNIDIIKDPSNSGNEKNFTLYQSSTSVIDSDDCDDDEVMDLEDIKEYQETLDNEVVDLDMDSSSNLLLDRVKQMELA